MGGFRTLPKKFGKMMSEKNWEKYNCNIASPMRQAYSQYSWGPWGTVSSLVGSRELFYTMQVLQNKNIVSSKDSMKDFRNFGFLKRIHLSKEKQQHNLYICAVSKNLQYEITNPGSIVESS